MNRLVLAALLLVAFLGLAGCADDGWNMELGGFIPDCDGDGDDLVSVDEFGSCNSHNINPVEFDDVDADNSGYIDDQEYQDYIHGLN